MVSSGYESLATTSFEDTEITEIPELILGFGGGSIWGIEIDNTGNQRDSFLKMWVQSAPVPDVGSSVPDWIVRIRAGKRLGFPFRGTSTGLPVAGLYVACVTVGGTEGKVPPVNPVFLTLKTS